MVRWQRLYSREYEMESVDVLIMDPRGLHAQNASQLVAMAMEFPNQTKISVVSQDGRRLDARSPMRLLSAGFTCGDALRIEADGPDECEAVQRMAQLVRSWGQ